MRRWFESRSSLRAKLLKGGLGIILLMGVLCFGTGVYFWGKIDRAIEERNIVNRVQISMLEARKAEKNFLLQDLTVREFYEGQTTPHLSDHAVSMASLHAETAKLTQLSSSEEKRIRQRLDDLAHAYQEDFVQLVAAYRDKGFKDWGLTGAWNRAMLDLEGYVERTQNAFVVRALLDLKRNEQNYLLRHEDRYITEIYEDLKTLTRMVQAHDSAAQGTILKAIKVYEGAFNNYVVIQDEIGITPEQGLQGRMQRAVEAIEPVIEQAHIQAIQVNEMARRNLLGTISMIWVTGLTLGGTFFYFHARSISRPIGELKDAALKIGQGELATRITVSSKDEIGVLAGAFNQMAADLSRALEALRESESHSRLIIETAHDAFIAIDVDGVIIDWNRQAENLFGWSREEAAGRRFDDTIVAPQAHQDQVEGSEHFLSTGEGLVLDQRLEMTAKHRQGHQFPVELTVWPIQLGQTYRFNAFIHDISERKQAEQMKSDFVSFVTHQLRTPLAGIKWLLELASEENALPEEPLSYIQDARESADRLIKLVNDLLDISRLERGKFTIAPEEVNLGELTHSVLSEVNLLMQQKGHQLRCLLCDEAPAVLADRQLIRQVVLNLVSNAIKYTPPGGEISVHLCQIGGTVQWSIADSGIGVPKQAQSRLFEKFYRAENGLTVETEGTGLGLYLVRLILGQFGGRVWCESEEGKGATFLFTLPLPE
jgi:PAS domain S-box-containing protein